MDPGNTRITQKTIDRQRWRLLRQVEQWLEVPVAALGILWLILLVLELVRGSNPFLSRATQIIWFIFIIEFVMRFVIAPRKGIYLRHNVLGIIALAVPAARGLRTFRALRAVRGLRLIRLLTALNRGMRALRRGLGRRGFGYAFALTLLVTLAGAAGMYAFENVPGGQGFATFSQALWWTGMLMTTIASEFWPRTAEGRVLAFLLSGYSVAVFGYLTAALASLFIEHTAQVSAAAGGGRNSSGQLLADIAALRSEVAGLRAELRARQTSSVSRSE